MAEDDVLHVRRVGDHGEEDFRLAGHLGRAGAGDGAGLHQGDHGFRAAGMDEEGPAGPAQVEGHGSAHDAQADEAEGGDRGNAGVGGVGRHGANLSAGGRREILLALRLFNPG